MPGLAAHVVLSLVCLAECAAAERGEFRDWRMYGGDSAGTKYSALDQINRTNVQRLKPAWVYHCGDRNAASTIECNPIVVDGILFLTTPGLKLEALDAVSGRLRWV